MKSLVVIIIANLNINLEKYGVSLGSKAIGGGELEFIKYLVEKGVNVNELLYYACSNGEVKIVNYLLERGADPSSEICLTASLEFYHQAVFKILIEAGAVIKSVSFYNQNFLGIRHLN